MGGFKEKALGRRGTALENLRKRKVGLPIVSRNIERTYIPKRRMYVQYTLIVRYNTLGTYCTQLYKVPSIVKKQQ